MVIVSASGPLGSLQGPRYATWNNTLSRSMDAFETAHADATLFEFSAYDTFTRILDSPESFGFNNKREDVSKAGGEIWVDMLHPTSAVHAVVAREMEEFLRLQPQNVTPYYSPVVEHASELMLEPE